MHDSISIVIPVYNEGQNIKETINEIETKVQAPHKILIIYDFADDNTIPVAREMMKTNNRIMLFRNQYGRGVLNAIKTGFQRVDSGVCLVVMADLSDDINSVDAMFTKINEGYDVVCGSRYVKGGKQIGGPWCKKLLSRYAGISLYHLTGIPTHDITNSFKMYRKKVLDDIEIQSNGGFELGMEITVKAYLKGYRVIEIPSTWKDRSAGVSRFRLWKWLPKYMRWYLLAVAGKRKKRAS